MMSRPPNFSIAMPTKRSAKPGAVTLPTQATASPPACLIVSTTSAAGSSSRSFTTTRAPSPASFSASARPMPRPEPEIRATLPCSLVMSCLSRMVLRQRDDSIAGERVETGVGFRVDLEPDALLAIGFELFDDLAGADDLSVDRRDGGEAHAPVPDTILRHPFGQELREECHGEHAVGENIGH